MASRLINSTKRSLSTLTKVVDEVDHPRIALSDNFFTPYQLKWIYDTTSLCIAAKGRRIGLTYAESFRASYDAMIGKQNTYYTSYNYHACKAFIQKCLKWIKAFNHGYRESTGRSLYNPSLQGSFKVILNNGYFIEALPGNAENLRDKEGVILIDEAAFRLDLKAVLDAANAITIWGGQLKIWSTHFGIENEFNKLCSRVKNDSSLGSYHFIPFMTAIDQGLYRKICFVTGKKWSQADQNEFIDKEYSKYGLAAKQELDAIPQSLTAGNIIFKSYFRTVAVNSYVISASSKVRFWDLASSTKDKSFYTATVICAIVDDKLVVISADAKQLDPVNGDDWIVQINKQDDDNTITLIEQEPGSTGQKYIESMKGRLKGYVEGYAPNANKVLKALPMINALKQGDVLIWDDMTDKEHFISTLTGFSPKPTPLVTDWVDCLSSIYDFCEDTISASNWIR